MAATAPLTSDWPRPSPLVDIPNWVDDVYLKRRGANASIGSRFAKSEPYARHVVFSLPPWPRSSPAKRPSIPNVPSFATASQLHQELKLFHQLRIIHPADRPRFTKPGSLCFPMVHDLVQPPSALRGSAATIPPLDFDLPFILFYSHRPYNSQPEDFDFITTANPPEDFEHDRHLVDFFEECIPIMTMTCKCKENKSSPINDVWSMLPRQTMRIRSWWRHHCRFCCQTDEIRKSVVPSVILAIADVLIIIILGRVGMQVSLYRMMINAKHDDTCNRHCHNSPLSLINQHVESINNVLYCMLLPMNKGKLNKRNKEFAHMDPHMILHWVVRRLLPLPLNDDPTIAMITFKPKLARFRMLNMDGDTIGLCEEASV